MDVIGGLTAVSQAIGIAKELKQIDRTIDDASFRLKIADLIESLAETKIALADAKEEIAKHKREIRKLNETLETARSGEACPICKTGQLKITAVRKHPIFGPMGHQEHDLECSNDDCSHREKRKVAPS